jgi:transcriptional regulator with XRE-family HTH domain
MVVKSQKALANVLPAVIATPNRRRALVGTPAVDRAVVRSEGQRLLIAVSGTLAHIASVTGVSPQAVSEWRLGKKSPSPSARGKLDEAFKIPRGAWSQLPEGMVPPESDDEPARAPSPGAAPSTLADCLRLLGRIQAALKRPNLLTSDLVRLTDTESKLLALRHRLEREADLMEDRLVREHPAWMRVKRELVRVLARHPAAMRDVAEVLGSLDM